MDRKICFILSISFVLVVFPLFVSGILHRSRAIAKLTPSIHESSKLNAEINVDQSYTYDICVIGGGVGGLVAASKIKVERKDLNVTVIEKNAIVGGRMNSEHLVINGVKFRFDIGKNKCSTLSM